MRITEWFKLQSKISQGVKAFDMKQQEGAEDGLVEIRGKVNDVHSQTRGR